MCGKVQCTNVDVNTPPPGAHVSIQDVEGQICVNADFNLGTDVLDPAYVNSGSPCEKGKVSRLLPGSYVIPLNLPLWKWKR